MQVESPPLNWYIGTKSTYPSKSGERATLKYSLGASVYEGQLCLLCLRRDLTGIEVVAALRIGLPASAEEEPAFLQEIAAFIIAGRIPVGVPVTLGVPRSSFLLRRFETPPVTARDLPELVGFEIERHLPGKSDDFYSGWRLEGRADGGGQSILLGAAPKAAVDRVLALLRRANLAPLSIQPEPFTFASCLRRVAPGVDDALVVDLGPNLVGIDSLHAGRLESSRVFPIDDPQWRETPAPAAAPGPSGAEASESLQSAAARLGTALAERITSPLFRESLGGVPAEIWVTGYGANRAAFIEKLREGLQLPVRILSPWTLARWHTPPADLVPFTGPLALALAGPHGTRDGIELAPERQDTLHRAPSRRLTAVLAGLLVLILSAHLVGYGLRQRRALEQADGEIQALKLKMTAVESVNRSVQEQRSRLKFLESAISSRARQADVLRELTGLIPDSAYLSEFSYRDRTVEITGLAPSASQLLPVLETSPLFVGVEFSAPIVAQGAGLERFKIRMRLEPAGG
jgi:general secretion pathway protein L